MTAGNKSVELASHASDSRVRIGSVLKRVGVGAVAVLMAGGLALPAVATNSGGDAADNSLASAFVGQEQSYEVSPELEAALALVPVEIEATSAEELAAIRERAEAEAERDREDAEEAASANDSAPATSAPPVSSAAGGIVGTAQSMLGVPYVFGGTTPAGFDCSGFTQWVFAQHGISLPRIAGAQSSVGSAVSVGDIQPGDLIVWPGHTGIYAGNGQMIHAPTAGSSVSYIGFQMMVNAMGTPEIRRF